MLSSLNVLYTNVFETLTIVTEDLLNISFARRLRSLRKKNHVLATRLWRPTFWDLIQRTSRIITITNEQGVMSLEIRTKPRDYCIYILFTAVYKNMYIFSRFLFKRIMLKKNLFIIKEYWISNSEYKYFWLLSFRSTCLSKDTAKK